MVSRSAYAQLRYSPWLLAGTVVGMLLVYLAAAAAGAVRRRRGAMARPRRLGADGGRASSRCCASTGSRRCGGVLLPADRRDLHRLHLQSAVEVWRGRGGMWKGRAQALARSGDAAVSAADLASGKGHTDENFPVASLLIAPEPPRADHGLLPLRARSPTTSPTTPRASPELKLERLGRDRGLADRQERGRARRRARCATRWPNAASAGSTCSTCWRRSAATSSSCATRAGTS